MLQYCSVVLFCRFSSVAVKALVFLDMLILYFIQFDLVKTEAMFSKLAAILIWLGRIEKAMQWTLQWAHLLCA